MYFGYACLNETLKTKFFTCRLSTYHKMGIDKLKQLTLDNINVVLKTLKWNIENEIYFYRITSGIVPLATHPDVNWKWEEDIDILKELNKVKNFVVDNNIRLTTHPGQYSVLNSPNKNTIMNTTLDFVYHSKLIDLMGGSDIVVHTGGAYGNKGEAKRRFVKNYNTLNNNIKKYLRLENDDKTFVIDDVLEISQMCGIPVVLDIHHHNCNPGKYDIKELIPHIVQTWNNVGKPKFHISTGKTHKTDISHHDYVSEEDYNYFLNILNGFDVDIMFESKKKELSILKLREKVLL